MEISVGEATQAFWAQLRVPRGTLSRPRSGKARFLINFAVLGGSLRTPLGLLRNSKRLQESLRNPFGVPWEFKKGIPSESLRNSVETL